MKNLEAQFADWVEKQPKDREYNYLNPGKCALCQFLADAWGIERPRVVETDWRAGIFNNTRQPLPPGLDDKLRGEPWTFGALAERLRA